MDELETCFQLGARAVDGKLLRLFTITCALWQEFTLQAPKRKFLFVFSLSRCNREKKYIYIRGGGSKRAHSQQTAVFVQYDQKRAWEL